MILSVFSCSPVCGSPAEHKYNRTVAVCVGVLSYGLFKLQKNAVFSISQPDILTVILMLMSKLGQRSYPFYVRIVCEN